jgi:hypothetical protein
MTDAGPPTGFRKWWADRRWKAGDRLDRMGRWLLLHAPRLFPGWTFGHE